MTNRIPPPFVLPPLTAPRAGGGGTHVDHAKAASAGSASAAHHLPLIQGVSEVAMYVAKHGINHVHIRQLVDFANIHNVSFAIQATNPYCAGLSKLAYPVVPPELESHSVHQFGPLSGLVPCTRLNTRNPPSQARRRPEKRPGMNSESQPALRTDLQLTSSRIDELVSLGVLKKERGSVDGGWRLTCESEGKSFVFIAMPVPKTPDSYSIRNDKGIAIQVFGKDFDDRVVPFAGGGYRLFMYGFRPDGKDTADLGEQHRTLLEQMNTAVGRTSKNPLISVADDDAGPKEPCLVFGPAASRIDGVAYAPDGESLTHIERIIKAAGYQLPANPAQPTQAKAVKHLHGTQVALVEKLSKSPLREPTHRTVQREARQATSTTTDEQQTTHQDKIVEHTTRKGPETEPLSVADIRRNRPRRGS